MTNPHITIALDHLANLCLDSHGTHVDYEDSALLDATLIFQEVFMAKMYDYQLKGGLNEEQMLILAEEAGKSLRQTIFLFTGKDTHKIAKE